MMLGAEGPPERAVCSFERSRLTYSRYTSSLGSARNHHAEGLRDSVVYERSYGVAGSRAVVPLPPAGRVRDCVWPLG